MKQKGKTINDPFLIFIEIPKGQGRSNKHNQAVALLATLLYKNGYEVNYDHVNATIPKNKAIPLELRTRKRHFKADLAFWIDNNTLVVVEVKTLQKGSFVEVKNG